MLKIILSLILVALTVTERVRYDGYHLLNVSPLDDAQSIALHDLLEANDYITLKEPNKRDHSALIIVPEEDMEILSAFFQHNSIEYFIENENIQKDLDETWARLDTKKSFTLDDFNRWEDIETKIDEWQASCVAGFTCEIEEIGRSYENRPLRVLKISKPSDPNRKILWFNSGIHAREWLAPATNLRVADTIFANTNEDAKALLDKYDFYFLFIVNPDGYIYSWDNDRFWRKSRNLNPGYPCIGTDLNRNFAKGWGGSGNPCSGNSPGIGPGSEPETQAVQNKAKSLGNQVLAWTSIHNHGKIWFTPHGFTDDNGVCVRPIDYDDIYFVAEKAAQAIEATYGTTWTYGAICEITQYTPGNCIDYTYDVGIKYSFQPELRGAGFNPGPEEIKPSFVEFWNGIVAMVKAIEEKGY